MISMTKPKIFILSGPIQSGKTSRLFKWCEGRNDVAGILTPDVDGKRFFFDIETKNLFLMEAGENEENILSIGKYKFSKSAFELASQILSHAINKNSGWIIVDEVGPLELKGEGFSEVIKKLFLIPSDLNIILVVRENLFDTVLQYFNIKEYSLFSEL